MLDCSLYLFREVYGHSSLVSSISLSSERITQEKNANMSLCNNMVSSLRSLTKEMLEMYDLLCVPLLTDSLNIVQTEGIKLPLDILDEGAHNFPDLGV